MLISHGARKRLTERIRRLIGGMPCRQQVAALPWRAAGGGIEVMLVTSRGSGRWVLPKGWAEGREAPHEAAAREAGEEAGIDGTVSRHDIGSFYYSKELPSGMLWRCQVRVFPMQVEREADTWPERKKRTRRWFPAREAANLVRERDLGELIAGFSAEPGKSAAQLS